MWDFERQPFSDADKAALRLATVMSNAVDDHTIPATLMDELRAHFDDGQIVELGMIISVLAGMARFLFSFDLADKEAQCPVQFPK